MSDRPLSRRTFLQRGAVAGAALGRLPLLHPGAQHVPTTLRDKVAQLFVISFGGTTAGPGILSLLERYTFGGIILFNRNCVTAQQTRTLIANLQKASRYPLLVCTDQEGGAVVRIKKGAPSFPSEASYGSIGSSARVHADAGTTAVDLRNLGLTMNLAPVVDVLSNPKSPIGTRSYGPDPHETSSLSVAAIRGYQQHGLAATAKHFIGLGHTSIDSHQSLPTVKQTWQQLESNDLIPFRSAIGAGVSSILVAHVALPKIDSANRPASLSPVVIKGKIRGVLGFKGVIMTDSLLMGAVPNGDEVDAARRALVAGADILLLGINRDIPAAVFSDAIERIVAGVQAGHISESVIDAALHRVLALKKRFPPLNQPAR